MYNRTGIMHNYHYEVYSTFLIKICESYISQLENLQ